MDRKEAEKMVMAVISAAVTLHISEKDFENLAYNKYFDEQKEKLISILCAEPEFHPIIWSEDGQDFQHPLKCDECICHHSDGTFHVVWGAGVSKYPTLKAAQEAITGYLQKYWQRIHSVDANKMVKDEQSIRIKQLEGQYNDASLGCVPLLPLCEAAYVLLMAHDSDCDGWEVMQEAATQAYVWLKRHDYNMDRIDNILMEHNRQPDFRAVKYPVPNTPKVQNVKPEGVSFELDVFLEQGAILGIRRVAPAIPKNLFGVHRFRVVEIKED